MEHLPEYLNHHLYLAAATVIVAIIAAAFELRLRAAGGSAVSVNQAIALHNKGALLLDVRSAEEFGRGHIVDARNIELEQLAGSLDALKKYREKPVIVYCEAGSRAAQAVKLLRTQGFNDVTSLQGGLVAWRQDNLPLTAKKA